MELKVNNASLEYFTENAKRFEEDYYRYIDTNIPFFAVEEEILRLLHYDKNHSMKIPATKTRDKKPHVFYFERKVVKENNRNVIYVYRGMERVGWSM